MIPMLGQIAVAVLAVGLVAIAFGGLTALSIYLKVTIEQPDFWRSRLYFPRRRLEFDNRVVHLALQKENTTRSGRIADWFLKRGTVLLIAGGIAKAALFVLERQTQ
jgi:uncharacterized membrane protein